MDDTSNNLLGAKINSQSTLFLDSDLSATILLQIAVFWIEQGLKVFYIRPTPHTNLPPDIHGTTTIQENLQQLSNLLRFFYLPGREELLEFLFTIHGAINVPHVIVVEKLNFYCCKESGNILNEACTALIFAALIDSLAVCAKKLSASTHLIASFNSDVHPYFKLYPILDIFFPNSVWIVKALSNDKIILTKMSEYFNETERTEIIFHKNQDKSLFFESINKILRLQ